MCASAWNCAPVTFRKSKPADMEQNATSGQRLSISYGAGSRKTNPKLEDESGDLHRSGGKCRERPYVQAVEEIEGTVASRSRAAGPLRGGPCPSQAWPSWEKLCGRSRRT
jgi:hypothetical protein